jgi:excisionase family DNA binding protein
MTIQEPNERPALTVYQGAKAALSVTDFCAAFGIGRTSFYAAVKDQKIKTVKFGRRTLVPATEIDVFLTRLSEAA